MLRRSKAWFLALAVLLVCASQVLASVTVIDFFAEGYEDRVSLFWETASETGNAGFYIWRSESEFGDDYEMITVFNVNLETSEPFIPGEGDDLSGGSYEVEDRDVEPGKRYYYKLADSPSDEGIESTFSDPVSATVLGSTSPGTSTPTLTPSPTSTPTLAPNETPLPTATPEQIPSVSFTADRTTVPADACATLQWQTSNVKSVFFDNLGVSGIGAKSFCPCAPETHVLRVVYHDDTSENFEISLTVDGTCTSDAQATATPTPEPPDADLVATATLPPAAGDDSPTATPPVGVATPTSQSSPDEIDGSDRTTDTVDLDITVTPDSLDTLPLDADAPPVEAISSTTATTGAPIVIAPERDVDDGDENTSPFRGTLVLLMMAVGLIGAGLVGGGIWLWRQHL